VPGRSSPTTGTSKCASCRWEATASISRRRKRSSSAKKNTIRVVAILGSTFDGSYEPIEEISDALDAFQSETGIDVPVHVDGGSGAFVRRAFTHDLADLLVSDIERQFPRLEKQRAPVHDSTSAPGFHH
jgi:Pyridoxal-dependent decarboxylase conserved domain